MEKTSHYQLPWGNWLYFGFFCQQFWCTKGENECEHKSGKSLFGMNLLFLHCFIWIKDFNGIWSQIQIISNVISSTVFTQRQTDKQIDRMLFSLMTSREHPFFHGEKKFYLKRLFFHVLLDNMKEYADKELVYSIKEQYAFR